jgi:hypothetical protein
LTSTFSYSITGHLRLISILLNYNQIVNNLNDNINIIKLGFNPKDIWNYLSDWWDKTTPRHVINFWMLGVVVIVLAHLAIDKPDDSIDYHKISAEEENKPALDPNLPIPQERSDEGITNFMFICCYIAIYFYIKNNVK